MGTLIEVFKSDGVHTGVMTFFLVRYGEIGLKGPNVRRRFEENLVMNIRDAFFRDGAEVVVERRWGRIYVQSDYEQAERILSHMFGIVSFSPAIQTTGEMDDIKAAAVAVFKDHIQGKEVGEGKEIHTFAVEARRTGTHKYTSMDLNRDVGSAIWTAIPGLKVELKTPDVRLFVEIRQNEGFIFLRKVDGHSGFPVGSQGKVLCILDRPSSFLALLLMAKRGCKPVAATSEEFIEQDWFKHGWEACEANHISRKIRVVEPDRFNLPRLALISRKMKCDGIVLGTTTLEIEDEVSRLKEDGEVERIAGGLFYPLVGLPRSIVEGYERRFGL